MRRLIFTFLLLVSSFTLFYGQSEADKRQARIIGSDAMALIRVKSYEKSHKPQIRNYASTLFFEFDL